MAITATEFVDFLFKKLVFGVTKTAKAADKTGSNETIASPIVVFPENIWSEKALIPASAPTSDTAQVKVYSGATRIRATADPTAQPNETWLATTTFGTPASRLGAFIPPAVGGSSYAARVFIGDPQGGSAARIFPDTTNEEWVFDYSAGVLNFPTNVPGTKAATIGSGNVAISTHGIYLELYRYIGATGAGGGGVDPSDLGTMAYQDSDDVNITGGAIANVTFINVTIDGGTF